IRDATVTGVQTCALPISIGSRHHEKRRGHRMNSRVPVRLEWDDESGKRVSAEAHTRVVNPYGCMVVIKHSLSLEHRLALTNLTRSEERRVGQALRRTGEE